VTLYLDTSALAKLLVAEDETHALRTYLREHRERRRVASSLVGTELRRAAGRLSPALLPVAEEVLSSLFLVPVDDALLDIAGTLAPAVLRSLDAVHLTSALRVAPLIAVVTYDQRLQEAARTLGLPVAAPGAEAAGRG
jgi:predicted nucleic acid-binding protein